MLAVVSLVYILDIWSAFPNRKWLHNAVIIFHLSVNLLTNVIVRLTTAVDQSDDNATNNCIVRAASNWTLLIQIVSNEYSHRFKWWRLWHKNCTTRT